MTNLFEFHILFSSSVLIRLNKNAFEGHLCQAVHNFVKHNYSSILSPLRKTVDILYKNTLSSSIMTMVVAIF